MEVITKLYKGKIEVKFLGPTEDKPNRHMYYVNGKRKKSVTGALGIIDKSRQLQYWAVGLYSDHLAENIGKKITGDIIFKGENLYTEKKREAANIGKDAHDWIEKYVKGEDPGMPEDNKVARAVTGFFEWAEENKVKFLASEKFIYSKKHDYAGLLDAIVTMNGKRGKFLVDYKASNGLYASVAYQTAAYQKADEEESNIKYAGRWALRLAKETEEEYMVTQEKKLKKYEKKNPGKSYGITPYVPFEAKFLDGPEIKVDRDFKAFLAALKLNTINSEVDREFFKGR